MEQLERRPRQTTPAQARSRGELRPPSVLAALPARARRRAERPTRAPAERPVLQSSECPTPARPAGSRTARAWKWTAPPEDPTMGRRSPAASPRPAALPSHLRRGPARRGPHLQPELGPTRAMQADSMTVQSEAQRPARRRRAPSALPMRGRARLAHPRTVRPALPLETARLLAHPTKAQAQHPVATRRRANPTSERRSAQQPPEAHPRLEPLPALPAPRPAEARPMSGSSPPRVRRRATQGIPIRRHPEARRPLEPSA